MTAQTLDPPSSASHRRPAEPDLPRPDAAPAAVRVDSAKRRPALDLRSVLRFATPWLLAIVLWSLLGCTPPPELVALDGESGAIRWRREGVGRVVGAHANRIVVEREHEIVGLDAGTGKEVWRIVRRRGARVVESLAPSVPHVVVLEPEGTLKGHDGATGKLGFEFALTVPAEEIRRVSPPGITAHFVQTHDGRLFRCRVGSSSPELLAQSNAAIAPVEGPLGGLVAVLADGSLAAFDFRSGAELWRIAGLPSAHSLAFRPDGLWLGGSRGALLKIDVATGEIRFALPDAGTDARLVGDPQIASPPTLVRVGLGISVLEPATGAVTRQIPFSDRISSAAVISRSILVRRAEDGVVVGFDRDSGERRFTVEVGPLRRASVVVLDPRFPAVSLLP